MLDITELKKSLRIEAKRFRESLDKDEKRLKDELIFDKLVSLEEFKNAKTILCYYSTEIEVDTLKFIDFALKIGKKVALPKCVNENGDMRFYYINSTDSLVDGFFGIKEPSSDSEEYVENSDSDICLVPALMIDESGYRLGYGKGYYDKFLIDFKGIKCVLCYNENVVEKLPIYESFDVKSDVSITD